VLFVSTSGRSIRVALRGTMRSSRDDSVGFSRIPIRSKPTSTSLAIDPTCNNGTAEQLPANNNNCVGNAGRYRSSHRAYLVASLSLSHLTYLITHREHPPDVGTFASSTCWKKCVRNFHASPLENACLTWRNLPPSLTLPLLLPPDDSVRAFSERTRGDCEIRRSDRIVVKMRSRDSRIESLAVVVASSEN